SAVADGLNRGGVSFGGDGFDGDPVCGIGLEIAAVAVAARRVVVAIHAVAVRAETLAVDPVVRPADRPGQALHPVTVGAVAAPEDANGIRRRTGVAPETDAAARA